MKSYTVSDIPVSKSVKRNLHFSVSENTVNMTTVECILKNTDNDRIVALNFANAMFPGGAYILGGNAQEESICRASMLYYTIKTQKKYYNANRLHIFPDYTDNMIYSKSVPIVRDDNGKLIENPVLCDFITSPAVNRTFAKFMFSSKYINMVMQRRIEKIISLALSENPDIIILGAFGCGMFGNKRETVLEMFEKSINKLVPDDKKVIFAIP